MTAISVVGIAVATLRWMRRRRMPSVCAETVDLMILLLSKQTRDTEMTRSTNAEQKDQS